MTDRELLALYVARDSQATTALQRQYGSYCAAIVSRILNDPRDAEECLNDLWMQVWTTLQVQQPDYLKGWLGATARNCAINRYRKLQRQDVYLADHIAELAQLLHNTTAEPLESQLLGECISNFLKDQPATKRIAFVRRYWYGDTVTQVAAHMGWSEAKTKTVLFHLRSKLKDFLRKEGYIYEK